MDDLARLRALVLADEGLQRRLFAAAEPEAFIAAVVSLAGEHGLDVTPTEVSWAIQDGRRNAVERWIS